MIRIQIRIYATQCTDSRIWMCVKMSRFRNLLGSVADPGYLSRILIFTHPGSRISDPGSRIQKQQQKRGVVKNLLSYLFM